MDAISFVLGVQSRHLRSQHLKDLVFRADGDMSARRRASVKLVYEVAADEIEGVTAGTEISFGRTISASGEGSYQLNEGDVSWEEYDKRLREIGVLVRARNFLVFQGEQIDYLPIIGLEHLPIIAVHLITNFIIIYNKI